MASERQALLDALRHLSQSGLSHGNSGNISLRAAGENPPLMLISPTGMSGDSCNPKDLVLMALDGSVLDDSAHQAQRRPSSEWPMHAAIYRLRPEVNAIVHCHSPWATALSTTLRDIPAFHYMVAAAGGNSIRCSPYATFGTTELSNNALTALADRRACLLGNHGQIATGANLDQAMALAEEVEHLAMDYSRALSLGNVSLLDDAEMAKVLIKFKSYGQQVDA